MREKESRKNKTDLVALPHGGGKLSESPPLLVSLHLAWTLL